LKALHKEERKPAPTDEELHHYVWGTWNVAMHDYMVLDVDVNDKVWQNIDVLNWSPEATRLEHEIHALMVQQERNGFFFDVVKGRKLGDHLEEEYAAFAEKAIDEIGRWYRPSDQRIHGRVNVGGTVTGRATHAAPNISQVPGVTILETKDYEQGMDWIVKHKDEGTFVDAHWKEKKGEWAIYVRGREGNHGWDCRELFTVPKGYKLVGCDLSGVEFRCLANLTFPFDDGELVEIVLNGDIHQINADLMGVSRSVAKRLLYAAMYGGGMAKLGSIAEPLSSEGRQTSLGKTLHAKLMTAMPSLRKAIQAKIAGDHFKFNCPITAESKIGNNWSETH